MLSQTQMHSGVVVCFLICLCLVGLIAAKCVPEKCGSMNVSYPFWIHNSHCGHPLFQINCTKDEDTGMLSPYFTAFQANSTDREGNSTYVDFKLNSSKIMKIDYEGHLVIDSTHIISASCLESIGWRSYFELSSGGPFTLSKDNRLVVMGNQSFGTYSFGKLGEARCVTMNLQNDKPYCDDGCCEINLPDNFQFINFTGGGVSLLTNESGVAVYSCGVSTIMDPSTFTILNTTNSSISSYGLRLNWGIGLHNCSRAKAKADYSCSSNAQCVDSPSGKGYVCKCLPGYEGNGYANGTDCTDINECGYPNLNKCIRAKQGGLCLNLAGSYNCSCANGFVGDGLTIGTGCRDIDECSHPDRNKCVGEKQGGICRNFVGSYNCSCAKGYVGNGFRNGTGCMSPTSNRLIFSAIVGSVSSFVVACLAACLLVWWLKKHHLKLVEAKYFQLLQQYIASTLGRESLRIFSSKELARASNYYSNEMLLGSGGFGTVFKGILLDGTLVAIKKSKQALNLKDDHEFLNEVTILSQINHRNIVKVFGCCIQTEFPMLVCEFVPNGTLFDHLHSKEKSLPWASRLQIAIETGEALAYLHSGASQPIFHRDIKSSNILLNERLSPKVADFGISRLISASNNTHVTTNNIKGTWGYLDPEYFRTFQLTEKSDVYSFGVVLVELLTALKPISLERDSEEMSLSSLFLSRFNNNRLTEILDNKVLEEENMQQMEDMGRIARECLHFERRKRPSMKEVVEELSRVRGGTRKMEFDGSEKCEDPIFEQTNISREGSQMSYKLRSYTFPSPVGSTSEEPFTALLQMSTL
ncbi:hypothetical protein SUGI_0466610 [Cryptomeria japonica]|nr:hypothetical protein SUGI_0466610 [Cryptomeria japonica]